jgi:hypothetical protein
MLDRHDLSAWMAHRMVCAPFDVGKRREELLSGCLERVLHADVAIRGCVSASCHLVVDSVARA